MDPAPPPPLSPSPSQQKPQLFAVINISDEEEDPRKLQSFTGTQRKTRAKNSPLPVDDGGGESARTEHVQ